MLLHGFGGDRLAWAELIGPLSKLRRAIAVDLPGHGEAVEWPEAVDAKVCAKAVIDSLDAMAVPRAVLVGHSMGGAVAAIVGLMRPDLVERLILLAPGGFGPEINVRLLRRYAEMKEVDEITLVIEQFFAPTSPIPEVLAKLVAEQRSDERIQRSFVKILGKITRGEGQGQIPLDDLAAQPFPTTLVWGLEDPVIPAAQGIAAPAAFARHLLPRVGHMPHMEAKDLVLSILVKTITGREE